MNFSTKGPGNYAGPQILLFWQYYSPKGRGRALGRPAFMPAPAFMMRLALGEFAEVILTGQKVLPKKLLAAGFQFSYPALDQALQNLLGEG